ncbi:MAG TPA: hypothetical protein DD473_05600, partial [Planctomycetaceae bacterium]|nr:hypothetical protein [Planctomycetaceae bacterium]
NCLDWSDSAQQISIFLISIRCLGCQSETQMSIIRDSNFNGLPNQGFRVTVCSQLTDKLFVHEGFSALK